MLTMQVRFMLTAVLPMTRLSWAISRTRPNSIASVKTGISERKTSEKLPCGQVVSARRWWICKRPSNRYDCFGLHQVDVCLWKQDGLPILDGWCVFKGGSLLRKEWVPFYECWRRRSAYAPDVLWFDWLGGVRKSVAPSAYLRFFLTLGGV